MVPRITKKTVLNPEKLKGDIEEKTCHSLPKRSKKDHGSFDAVRIKIFEPGSALEASGGSVFNLFSADRTLHNYLLKRKEAVTGLCRTVYKTFLSSGYMEFAGVSQEI